VFVFVYAVGRTFIDRDEGCAEFANEEGASNLIRSSIRNG